MVTLASDQTLPLREKSLEATVVSCVCACVNEEVSVVNNLLHILIILPPQPHMIYDCFFIIAILVAHVYLNFLLLDLPVQYLQLFLKLLDGVSFLACSVSQL